MFSSFLLFLSIVLPPVLCLPSFVLASSRSVCVALRRVLTVLRSSAVYLAINRKTNEKRNDTKRKTKRTKTKAIIKRENIHLILLNPDNSDTMEMYEYESTLDGHHEPRSSLSKAYLRQSMSRVFSMLSTTTTSNTTTTTTNNNKENKQWKMSTDSFFTSTTMTSSSRCSTTTTSPSPQTNNKQEKQKEEEEECDENESKWNSISRSMFASFALRRACQASAATTKTTTTAGAGNGGQDRESVRGRGKGRGSGKARLRRKDSRKSIPVDIFQSVRKTKPISTTKEEELSKEEMERDIESSRKLTDSLLPGNKKAKNKQKRPRNGVPINLPMSSRKKKEAESQKTSNMNVEETVEKLRAIKENETLRERVEHLEMESFQKDVLHGEISYLEFALDELRQEAEEYNELALEILANTDFDKQQQQQKVELEDAPMSMSMCRRSNAVDDIISMQQQVF